MTETYRDLSAVEDESWAVSTFRSIGRYAASLVLIVVMAAAIAVGVTAAQSTTYSSRTSLVLQTATGPADSETIIRTVQALVDTDAVGAEIASAADLSLSPQQVSDKISVQRPPGSGLIDIIVTDTNRARSEAIAGKLPGVFQTEIAKLAPPRTSTNATGATYTVTPWSGGAVFTSVNRRPYVVNGLIAASLGVILMLIFVAVRRQIKLMREKV